MMDKKLKGYLAAFFCAIVWGVTPISAKVLLREFPLLDILFYRFLLGYVMLWLTHPKWFKPTKLAHELYSLAAGASGAIIYYLLENMALTYSLTTNVSIIISIAPFLTALVTYSVPRGEKMKKSFFIGLVVVILGVVLVTFNGRAVLKLNPLEDMLTVGAAVAWASHSIIIRKMGKYECPVILTTRRIFFYGLSLMIPLLKPMDFVWNPAAVTQPVYLSNFLFPGICACALCFSVRSHAVDTLGAVISSNYIYTVPVITAVTSAIVLKEPITPMGMADMVLTIVGLVISARQDDIISKRQIRTITAGLVPTAACIGPFWVIKLGTGDRTSDGGKETTEWSEPSSENGEESGGVVTPADVESETDDDVESGTAVEAGADVGWETNIILPPCRTRWKKSGDTEPAEEVKGPPKIIIASDPHVLAKGLTDGGAVLTKKMDDGKTTLYSGGIVEAFLGEVLVERPDALVLGRDLTFEGERPSHLEPAGMLKKVQDADIQVLAVPGNRDTNNPGALAYFDTDDMTDDMAGYRVEKSGGSDKATGKEMTDGETEKEVGEPGTTDCVIETGTGGTETEDSRSESLANQEQTGEASEKTSGESITVAEPAEIYGEYGHEQAASRGENFLSYIYPLRDDVWVMMLDINRYGPVNLVDGDIRSEIYQWMIQELGKADEAGIMVVPIGCHSILSVSRLYTRECTIQSRASAIWLSGEHNPPLYLSGHLHVQRIKKYKIGSGVPKEVYDVHEIMISSLGMIPHQYGILIWDDSYQLEYQVRRVDVEN